MANGNQLSQAYSILGQATTAEYKRRRREEEEYRRRARRDQLLGYVLAPIGAEIGKGVSDIISAPFKDATEKFLATEQGRALNKDMNVLNGWAERTNALDKIILKDHGGDANAYHLGLAESAITKQVTSKYLSLGISQDELNDKNSEAGRAFRIELQQELKNAPAIADRETNQYLDFKAALSGYKKGQDAKEVISKYKPYASGPLGGLLNLGKRVISGVSFSEAVSGPTKAEKEKAVREARQALNLTEEEFASLSSKASSGLSFALLEKEMDRLATSKSPGIERVRARIKQTDELEAAFFSGELPPSYAKNYRKFQAEKERRPSLDELLFYIEEKEGIDSLGFSQDKRRNLISTMSTVSSVAALKTEFTDNVLKQLGYANVKEAPLSAIEQVDGKWNNILNSALYSAQLDYAKFSNSAPENNPLLLMSSSEKEKLIVQNAIDKLSSLERKTAEEGAVNRFKKFFDMEVIPTPGDFTGAFNVNALNTASPQTAVTEIKTNVVSSLGPLPEYLLRDVLKTAAVNEQEAMLKINALEEGGFEIPIPLKKLDFTFNQDEPSGPLTQAQRKTARGRGERVDLSELLPESPSKAGRMGRDRLKVDSSREDQTEVIASSPLEPIPLDQTEDILEKDLAGRRVLRKKGITPRSQMVLDRLKELVSDREENKQTSILSKDESSLIDSEIAVKIAEEIKSLKGFESLAYNEIEDALNKYSSPVRSMVLDILFKR